MKNIFIIFFAVFSMTTFATGSKAPRCVEIAKRYLLKNGSLRAGDFLLLGRHYIAKGDLGHAAKYMRNALIGDSSLYNGIPQAGFEIGFKLVLKNAKDTEGQQFLEAAAAKGNVNSQYLLSLLNKKNVARPDHDTDATESITWEEYIVAEDQVRQMQSPFDTSSSSEHNGDKAIVEIGLKIIALDNEALVPSSLGILLLENAAAKCNAYAQFFLAELYNSERAVPGNNSDLAQKYEAQARSQGISWKEFEDFLDASQNVLPKE